MYKFIKLKDESNNFDNTDITMEIDTVSRQDLIEEFILFLGASGFNAEDLKELFE